MDADKKLLKNAPGFDKDNWPETPNGQWYHDVYKYYDQEPYWLLSCESMPPEWTASRRHDLWYLHHRSRTHVTDGTEKIYWIGCVAPNSDPNTSACAC